MRVHVVNSGNRRQYLDLIEEMHRQRHRIFVDLMGWKALESPDKLDIDEFDTPAATYLIAIEDGQVRGSLRLVPTWRPNMLKNLFPEYVDGAVPEGPGIWEWTRHIPGDPQWSKETNNKVRFLLHIAVLEFAASRDIQTVTGIVDTRIVARMEDLGWNVIPLGLPVQYGEGCAFAFKAPVNLANIEDLRQRIGRDDSILLEMPRGLNAQSEVLTRHAVEMVMSVPTSSLPKATAALQGLMGAGDQ